MNTKCRARRVDIMCVCVVIVVVVCVMVVCSVVVGCVLLYLLEAQQSIVILVKSVFSIGKFDNFISLL